MKNACAVMVLLLTAACQKTAVSTGDGGTQVLGSLPIDGLVLVAAPIPNAPLGLVDPRTGKLGVEGIAVNQNVWDVSPRGTEVVHAISPTSIGISKMSVTAAGPKWEQPPLVKEVPNDASFTAGHLGVRFNSLGDRAAADTAWWDWEKDQSVVCPKDTRSGTHLLSPDGRHHVLLCNASAPQTILYDDMTPLLPLGEQPIEFSADGQWLIFGTVEGNPISFLHVPSLTYLTHPSEFSQAWTLRDDANGFPVRPAGNFGQQTETNPVTEIVNVWVAKDAAVPGMVFAPFDAPEGNAVLATPQTALPVGDPALFHTLPGPDYGNGWVHLGNAPDGNQYLAVEAHQVVTVQDSEGLSWTQIPYSFALRRISATGETRDATVVSDIMGSTSAEHRPVIVGIGPLDVRPLRFGRERPVLAFTTGEVLVAGANGWMGMDANGTAILRATESKIPSLDGAWLMGSGAPRPDGKFCATPTLSGDIQCIALGYLTQAEAIVGHNAPGIVHSTTLPVPVAIAPTAAVPGQSVHLFGFNFGTSGTLKVGAATVPDADIVAWKDGEIVFKSSDSLPSLGVVSVSTLAGAQPRSIQIGLAKTRAWASPSGFIPNKTFNVFRGLNAIGFPGTGALNVGDADYNKPAPFGFTKLASSSADSLEFFADKTDPSHTRLTFWTERFWTYRPVTEQAALDPAIAWNVLTMTSGASADWLFDAFPSALVVRGLNQAIVTDANAGPILKGTCYATNQCPFPILPSRDLLARLGDKFVTIDGNQSLRTFKDLKAMDAYLTPDYDPQPLNSLALPYNQLAAAGTTLYLARQEQVNGQNGMALRISRDSGATFDAEVHVSKLSLGPPVAILDGDARFFGLAGTATGTSFYRVDATGAFEPNFAAAPPGLTSVANRPSGTVGKHVVHLDPATKTLWALDTSATAPVWKDVGGTLSGHLVAASMDDAHARVLVGTDDARITAFDGAAWTELATVTLGSTSTKLAIVSLGCLSASATGLAVIAQDPADGKAFFLTRQK